VVAGGRQFKARDRRRIEHIENTETTIGVYGAGDGCGEITGQGRSQVPRFTHLRIEDGLDLQKMVARFKREVEQLVFFDFNTVQKNLDEMFGAGLELHVGESIGGERSRHPGHTCPPVIRAVWKIQRNHAVCTGFRRVPALGGSKPIQPLPDLREAVPLGKCPRIENLCQ
jgi:hypothetical protein